MPDSAQSCVVVRQEATDTTWNTRNSDQKSEENIFTMKDIQILDQGSKDVHEITILGHIQLSGGEGPEQPDLVRSA